MYRSLEYVMFTSCNDVLYIMYYYIVMLVGQLENTETRERKWEQEQERERKQPKDLENVSHILSPRVSDEPELAPHWVHSSIRKLIPRRHSCFVIVEPRVVVYRLSSSQVDSN